jgi:hypothetical protein
MAVSGGLTGLRFSWSVLTPCPHQHNAFNECRQHSVDHARRRSGGCDVMGGLEGQQRLAGQPVLFDALQLTYEFILASALCHKGIRAERVGPAHVIQTAGCCQHDDGQLFHL